VQSLVLMGKFSHVMEGVWDNTARHELSWSLLGCIVDNFLLQMTEEPIRRAALLHLTLPSNEELIGNVKVKGSLGCSDHEMVEFRILRIGRRIKSMLTALDFRSTEFCVFKDLLGSIP